MLELIMSTSIVCGVVISLTINLSTGVFFFFAPVVTFPFSKSEKQTAKRLVKFYKEKPSLIRKL